MNRHLAVVLLTICVAFFTGSTCGAQDDDEEDEDGVKYDWLIWDSVQRFSGQATIQETAWIDRDDPFRVGAAATTLTRGRFSLGAH